MDGRFRVALLSEIASLVGGAVPQVECEVLRVASISAATPATLVFAMDPATLQEALRSPAAAILTRATLLTEVEKSKGLDTADPRLLPVDDPRFAFALAAQFLKAREMEENRRTEVHPTAVLGEKVRLGVGTRIGPHVVIGDDVVLGDDCTVLANVTIYAGCRIGNRVLIQSGAVLGSTGFGYARNPRSGAYVAFPQQGTLLIEDDVEIGANTTIDRGALGQTRIGAGTKIDNLVHIAHNCVLGRNVIIAAQTGISGSSVIEDGAILGGQVGLGEHAHVGPGVILGGGAGVLSHKKVRGPGEVFWGRPARPLKRYLRDLARLSRG